MTLGVNPYIVFQRVFLPPPHFPAQEIIMLFFNPVEESKNSTTQKLLLLTFGQSALQTCLDALRIQIDVEIKIIFHPRDHTRVPILQAVFLLNNMFWVFLLDFATISACVVALCCTVIAASQAWCQESYQH